MDRHSSPSAFLRPMLGALGMLIATGLPPTMMGSASGEEPAGGAPVDVTMVAREIDQLLEAETRSEKPAAPRTDDQVFVRRIYLDLVGEPPRPEEVTRFALDPSTSKRAALVENLLADKRFGQTWGAYFRDVILYRRTEQRAADLVGASLAEFLAAGLNDGTGWDAIAKALITAKGNVRDNGATGLIAAQSGQPEDVTSEVSRIFLGIQIQCAQCHDHPSDRWKRDEFHRLAAFFPRIAMRPDRTANNFDFIVSITDEEPRFRPRNADNRFFGTLEHYMPDLKDPSAKGTLVKPVFFLTGQSMEPGAKDEDRRNQLAAWISAKDNPWFAKAFVNRIWSELVGEGFYEPVDDIGPERECSAPKALDRLATGFTLSGYDPKWLFRTIGATEAYQRASRSRRAPDETPYRANCPQKLRSDQLLNAILSLLDIPQTMFDQSMARGPNVPPQLRRLATPRLRFALEFGYDPSERRDEVSSSIPQALILMNGPNFQQAIASPASGLSRMLRTIPSDEDLVAELYLKAYAREPNTKELKTCLEYVAEVNNRPEAFQDIVWALLNSTEFLYRN